MNLAFLWLLIKYFYYLKIIFINLDNGQEYQLHIAAVNEVGTSENATEQLITPTGIPDGEPLNIRYTIFRNKVRKLKLKIIKFKMFIIYFLAFNSLGSSLLAKSKW